MEYFEGCQDSRSIAIFEQFNEDGVAVVVVQDHNVVVASAGRCWELAGLVGVNLAPRVNDDGKAGMGLVAIGLCIGVKVGECFGVVGLGGSLILPALVQMSLVHGHGGWRESLEARECEAGKFGNVLAAECFC